MTLTPNYDPNNVFAKIIRGEIPAVRLFEDDDVLAFMDAFPQTEGHCLVIPKRAENATIFELDDGAFDALARGVRRLARAVKEGLAPDGIRIAQFNGAAAGQTVFHVHFHVIPVYAGAGERPHASGGAADKAALEAAAARIRAVL